MLDENALRRPEFVTESAPIVLLDGQTWYLPKPWIRFAPCGSELGLKVKVWFLERFEPTLSQIMQEREAVKRELLAATGLVALDRMLSADLKAFSYLLRVNYDLSDEQIEDLVQFGGDPVATRLREDFQDILFGVDGPKASTGGSV